MKTTGTLTTEYYTNKKDFDKKESLVSVNFISNLNKFRVVRRINENDKTIHHEK